MLAYGLPIDSMDEYVHIGEMLTEVYPRSE